MKVYEYNLNRQPASFDFLVWLDKCYAIEKKPFHIVINGSPKKTQVDVYGSHVDTMFNNVVIPSMQLFPVTYELFTGKKGNQLSHIPNGGRLGNITVPDEILEKTSFAVGKVIIVIRQTPWHPQRNSNISAWKEVIKHIDKEVIIMEDGVKNHFPLAIRAGIYQNAYCVLGVNGGAMALAWHNKKVNYVTYKPLADAPCCTWQDYKDKGFTEGGSWPWATDTQIYYWGEDTAENILEGYNNIKARLNIRKSTQ
jgi:hypothetical protein